MAAIAAATSACLGTRKELTPQQRISAGHLDLLADFMTGCVTHCVTRVSRYFETHRVGQRQRACVALPAQNGSETVHLKPASVARGLLLAIALAAASASGCGTVEVQSYGNPLDPYENRLIEGFTFGDSRDVATRNRKILDRDYGAERSFYPTHRNGAPADERPDIAIALSGGGMRSAAYSIGVLSGLAREHPDDFARVDILSSVSGGSYALSWYYLQQYYLQTHDCLARQCGGATVCASTPGCAACPDQVLNPIGPFQKRIQKHGGLTGKIRGLLASIPDLALIPLNLITNGVFGWHENTSPSRELYENRIEQVFQRLPDDACGNHTNGYRLPLLPHVSSLRGVGDDVSNWPSLGIKDSNVTCPMLGGFAYGERLPLFVINATLAIDDDPNHYAAKLSNSVFEFTPLHLGSSALGYRPWDGLPDPPTVATAVAVSGAAVDSAVIAGSSQKTAFSLLNLDTGYYIDNPNPLPTAGQRMLERSLPFPFYLGYHYIRDKNGVRIYLSDGGHSENLGAFSLVRRLPKRIIVIDAEQDYNPHSGGYRFDAYYKLKIALKGEMGVDFTVPQIEQQLSRVGPFKTPSAVMEGTIRAFPFPGADGTVVLEPIAVTYIKLSIDSLHLDQYPQTVRDYYQQTKDDNCEGLLDDCPFPQQSTVDQSYSALQFEAYRDLGYWTVQHQYPPRSEESAGPATLPGPRAQGSR